MLVFDLDDTLYLERHFAFSGYRHLDALIRHGTGRSGFEAACRALFETGERKRIFDRACEEIGLAPTPARIGDLVAAYREHRPDIALCNDAAHFLRNAKGPLGLITDGPEVTQRNKIAVLGLSRWIAHIRPTGAWPPGFGKPHPRAFLEMEQAAGPIGRMVYVADNPAKDFVTPKARGWLTIQILRPEAVHDPVAPDNAHAAEMQVESLAELPPVP